MNNKAKLIGGKICFWLFWPGLYVRLKTSTRTRVIISSGDQILLIKNWLGPGDYTLPGGGIRKDEKPEEGAAREIKEETGLDIDARSLTPIKPLFTAVEKGLRYRCYGFSLRLGYAGEVNRQKFEIAEIKWVKTGDVLSKYHLGSTARQLITTWLDHNHLLD